MFTVIKHIWEICSSRRRLEIILFFPIVIVVSLLEVGSVAVLTPFLLLLSGNGIPQQGGLSTILQYMPFDVSDLSFDSPSLRSYLLFLLVFFVAKAIIAQSSLYFLNYLCFSIKGDVQQRVLHYFLKMRGAGKEDAHSSKIIQMLTTEADYLLGRFLNPITNALISFVPLMALIGSLFAYSFRLTLVVLTSVAVIMVLFRALTVPAVARLAQTQRDTQGAWLKRLQEAIEFSREIRLYDLQEKVEAEALSRAHSVNNKGAAILTITNGSKYFLELAAVAGIVSVLVVLNRGGGGSHSEAMSFFGVFAIVMFKALPLLNVYLGSMQLLRAGKDTVIGLLDATITLTQRDKAAQTSDDQVQPSINHIEVEKLRIQVAPDKILGPFTFEAVAGDVVHLTGRSGTGKSSLLDALTGLRDVASGEIRINGDPTDHYVWRHEIGYAPQKTMLFNATVRDNIIVWRQCKPEDIETALDCAGAKEFMEENQLNLDSVLSEGGGNISGGQRQRIGIARALAARPSLIILDECTSGVSEDLEREIIARIRDAFDQSIMIIVSHRASTKALCNRTWSLDGPRTEDVAEPASARST